MQLNTYGIVFRTSLISALGQNMLKQIHISYLKQSECIWNDALYAVMFVN